MAYLDQTRRPSPASMAGVIAIHAAVGVAIVTGLTVSGTLAPPDEFIPTYDIKDAPPPPPEPTPEPTNDTPDVAQVTPPMVIPKPPLDLPVPAPRFDSTEIILPPAPPVPRPGPTLGLDPVPTPRVPPTQEIRSAPQPNRPNRWNRRKNRRGAGSLLRHSARGNRKNWENKRRLKDDERSGETDEPR